MKHSRRPSTLTSCLPEYAQVTDGAPEGRYDDAPPEEVQKEGDFRVWNDGRSSS